MHIFYNYSFIEILEVLEQIKINHQETINSNTKKQLRISKCSKWKEVCVSNKLTRRETSK